MRALFEGEGAWLPTLRSSRRVATALVLAAGAFGAPYASAQESRKDVARTEAQWLDAARQAAQRTNYSGTIVYQAGGDMSSSRVTHLFDGSKSLERIQTLDGKPREYLRRRSDSDDEVQCLIPESKKIIIEKRSVEESFPSLSSASPQEILQRYQARLGAVERVAGHEAQALALEPRDEARYAYRLWLEVVTGLLLKAQTLNDRKEVIEQISFSDVRIGDRIDRAQLKPAWSTSGWSVVRSDYRLTNLAAHGWSVPTPDGFRKTKEVARRMGATEAMQVVFGDGLATVSVFIEPGSPVMEPAASVQVHGPTSAFSRRVGDALVTVVGEVPPGTIRAVAQSVEFRGTR
jgi:sigma-E factor negative regulatory protein RseB